MSESPATLSLIFVVYRNYSDFSDFLGRQEAMPDDVTITVVDNTEHDRIDSASLDRWKAGHHLTVLVPHPENLGYLGAAQYALDQQTSLRDSSFVAVCNTDLDFQIHEFASVLRSSWVPSRTDLGVIAPRLVTSDGTPTRQLHYLVRPSRRHYERLVQIFSRYWLTVVHRLCADLLTRVTARHKTDGYAPTTLFAPHGALMIFSRRYLSSTAGFRYPAFLFCEEIFVGNECDRAGLVCVLEPRLTYSHKRHGAMKRFPSRFVVQQLRDAHRTAIQWLD